MGAVAGGGWQLSVAAKRSPMPGSPATAAEANSSLDGGFAIETKQLFDTLIEPTFGIVLASADEREGIPQLSGSKRTQSAVRASTVGETRGWIWSFMALSCADQASSPEATIKTKSVKYVSQGEHIAYKSLPKIREHSDG